MKPTIGRIVWVRLGNEDRICPGIVCEVHSDTCISIQVLNREGGQFVSSCVQGSVDATETPATISNRWDWMPYQKSKGEENVERSAADAGRAPA